MQNGQIASGNIGKDFLQHAIEGLIDDRVPRLQEMARHHRKIQVLAMEKILPPIQNPNESWKRRGDRRSHQQKEGQRN